MAARPEQLPDELLEMKICCLQGASKSIFALRVTSRELSQKSSRSLFTTFFRKSVLRWDVKALEKIVFDSRPSK
jgi:hypothetical protein